MTQGNLSKIERGDTRPSAEMLAEITKRWGVNAHWLLTGEGEMLQAKPDKQAVIADLRKTIKDKEVGKDEYVYVPLLSDVKAAGAGAFVDNEEHSRELVFRKDWISSHDISSNTLSAIHVTGDSMFPTLANGDVLLVDHSKTEPIPERIFIVRIEDSIVVKRSGGLLGGKLTLCSDNPVIGNRVVDMEKDNVAVVGRVVWFGRTV